jgi:hypothetical protein
MGGIIHRGIGLLRFMQLFPMRFQRVGESAVKMFLQHIL